MEQVLAPRFDFTPKDAGPKPGFDYGAGGYKEGETNFGVNDHGQMHFEIKGLKLPKSVEATRICREDLNEVIASFVQDKRSEEHTSELQSLMRISYAVFCLKTKQTKTNNTHNTQTSLT